MDATVRNPTAYFETVRLSTGTEGMETPMQPDVTEHLAVPGCGNLTATVVWAARVIPPTPRSPEAATVAIVGRPPLPGRM